MAEKVSEEEIRKITINSIKKGVESDFRATDLVSKGTAKKLADVLVNNYVNEKYAGGRDVPIIKDEDERVYKLISINQDVKKNLSDEKINERLYDNLMKTKISVDSKNITIHDAVEYAMGSLSIRNSQIIESYLNAVKVLGKSDLLLNDIKQNVTKAYLKKAESKS